MTSEWDDGRIRFGAAYYYEYQPTESLERDLDLMREANFTVIRVGESVWSTWEPRNGEFSLEWMQPVLDGAHARGIDVILGTPTYAVPPWLFTQYPEIAGQAATGVRHPWGARQEVDITHPAFLFHAERVIRRIVERYASHPAVIGYQLDNEPGVLLLHNPATFRRFVDWLRERYGDADTLNREWGLTYWSHRISDFSELWVPDGNAQPQYDLAWRRFQDGLVTEFIGWQADIVREYARPDQFVTTCLALDRPALNEARLGERLDVTASNPYYAMQDHLDLTKDLARPTSWTRSGVQGLLELADRSYGVRGERFLVTETNAQSIGGSSHNLPPYPGQLVQAGLALVARGAAMIEYWHWHSLHYGTETYWMGVLPHSQQPGRVYRELTELGSVLKAIGPSLTGYVPDADVAVLWSTDSKHALEFQPPIEGPDAAHGYVQRNPAAYATIVNAFHRGVLDAGGQAHIVDVEHLDGLTGAELASRYPVVVAAGLYVATDDLLRLLVDYAEAGGHLVVGIRTGYGDDEARARMAVAPDGLAEAAGIDYEEFSSLAEPLRVTGADGFTVPEDAAGLHWADGVRVHGAEVLARYEHPWLGTFPAVTRHRAGRGQVTYVGTVPNRGLARALFADVVTPLARDWERDPAVTVLSGTTGSGRVVFLHNWSSTEASATVPVTAANLVDGESLAAGSRLTLPAWGVVVLQVND
ncbi:MAG TPA: beta-galactosidase [Propionibacteriaceae bacterium]|nr:beta-galactosidase [Propionibacteriaceae bacterium]